MAENYGFNAGGDFAPAYQAAQAALQQRFLKAKGDLAQSLAARGVRTSGVATIPEAELASSETAANAGLISQFGEKQAETGIEDRRIAEERAFQREMQDRQGSLYQTLARRQLQGQLIAGGLGAAGNAGAAYLGA